MLRPASLVGRFLYMVRWQPSDGYSGNYSGLSNELSPASGDNSECKVITEAASQIEELFLAIIQFILLDECGDGALIFS